MKEMVYGYIRVSTKEQNEARQIHAMLDFGIAAENMVIFITNLETYWQFLII